MEIQIDVDHECLGQLLQAVYDQTGGGASIHCHVQFAGPAGGNPLLVFLMSEARDRTTLRGVLTAHPEWAVSSLGFDVDTIFAEPPN